MICRQRECLLFPLGNLVVSIFKDLSYALTIRRVIDGINRACSVVVGGLLLRNMRWQPINEMLLLVSLVQIVDTHGVLHLLTEPTVAIGLTNLDFADGFFDYLLLKFEVALDLVSLAFVSVLHLGLKILLELVLLLP